MAERFAAHLKDFRGPSVEKRCFIVDVTASPTETPYVTSRLRVSVQPAKPASPIRFLYEELPKVYAFSAYRMFTTVCAHFPNRISHFKILAMA